MTPQQLLAPRYRVIADYPFNNHFEVGDIICLNSKDDNGSYLRQFRRGSQSSDSVKYTTDFYKSDLDNYPHLFKKIEWWEERSIETLPKYVKVISPKNRCSLATETVYKTDGWQYETDRNIYMCEWLADINLERFAASHFIPSDLTEYNNYKSSLKQNE